MLSPGDETFISFITILFSAFGLLPDFPCSYVRTCGRRIPRQNSSLSYIKWNKLWCKKSNWKIPIEHILKREKNKIVKKIDLIEKEVVEKSINAKNTLNDKKDATKKKWVLHLKEIKNVKNEDAFPANKPRYSYWSKAK